MPDTSYLTRSSFQIEREKDERRLSKVVSLLKIAANDIFEFHVFNNIVHMAVKAKVKIDPSCFWTDDNSKDANFENLCSELERLNLSSKNSN